MFPFASCLVPLTLSCCRLLLLSSFLVLVEGQLLRSRRRSKKAARQTTQVWAGPQSCFRLALVCSRWPPRGSPLTSEGRLFLQFHQSVVCCWRLRSGDSGRSQLCSTDLDLLWCRFGSMDPFLPSASPSSSRSRFCWSSQISWCFLQPRQPQPGRIS